VSNSVGPASSEKVSDGQGPLPVRSPGKRPVAKKETLAATVGVGFGARVRKDAQRRFTMVHASSGGRAAGRYDATVVRFGSVGLGDSASIPSGQRL
jgi:hypothetical protein